MKERAPYPNVSDEELDRRGEEALKRMLDRQQSGNAQPNRSQQNNGQPNNGGRGPKPHNRKRRR